MSERPTRRPTGANADEWHDFLSYHLDNCPPTPGDYLSFTAVQIAEAIEECVERQAARIARLEAALRASSDAITADMAEAVTEIERLQRVIASIPQLRPGQLQDDMDTPGLFIRCDTIGQRAAIWSILLDAAAALADAPEEET